MRAEKNPMRFAPELTDLLVPVGELELLENNPRRGDVDAIARSYSTFGQRRPIVYQTRDGQRVVVAGNHQLQAALQLGWDHVAAVSADDLSEDEVRAFVIADNRIGQLGDWDDDALVQSLLSVDDALLGAIGFSDDELEEILGEPEHDWDAHIGGSVPSADREPIQQMTFTLHDDQVAVVKEAMDRAKAAGLADIAGPNENGNLLAGVAIAYLAQP